MWSPTPLVPLEPLRALIQTTLADRCQGGRRPVLGTCRIPWARTVLQDATGMTWSRSLDDTSVACGADLVGEMDSTADQNQKQRQLAVRNQELSMSAMDLDETFEAGIQNRIKAHV
jgi:hypothetical protein